MTGKWTIKKLNRHDGKPLPMPWHAIPPHTPIPPRELSHHSMRVLYEDDDVGTGVTHGEAMGYVNEQIRAAKKALGGTDAKPLAEMAPEEQQECVGMWCDNLASTAKEPAPVVLAGVQGGLCWVLHTDLYGERSRFLLGSVVPRHDLPRAWNPDGTPVVITKEYRAVSKHPDSSLGIGPTTRSRWYPTRDEAIANRDPRVIETYSRLIGIEHRYATQPEDSDG